MHSAAVTWVVIRAAPKIWGCECRPHCSTGCTVVIPWLRPGDPTVVGHGEGSLCYVRHEGW